MDIDSFKTLYFQATSLRKKILPGKMRVGLISTMPKSGTWYNHYFFHFYNNLLKGETNIDKLIASKPPMLEKNIVGLDALYICHSTCPGFSNYNGKYRDEWNKLNCSIEGFNYGDDFLNRNKNIFDPSCNKDLKLVYFFRNPLDQAVSFFKHIQDHKNKNLRYRTDSEGNKVLMENVKEYLHLVGFEAYLRQYLTFKFMKALYPDNIMMITYEALVRNPRETFSTVLTHFGHNVGDSGNEEKFDLALKLSNKDTMQKMESSLKGSLGGDQIGQDSKHIRDGEVGKWKKHFSDEDIEKIKKRLNQFDLTLNEFDIE